MTEPQPVMAQAEQDRLTRQVGRALLTVAGDGWQRVRAEYRSAGRHVEADVFITGPDGTEHPVRPPQEVVEGLGRLRQGMYRPGRGTWLSALYLLEPPSAFSAEFEPDVEPQWRRVPPPIGFQDELRFFPRADEHIPGWLRQRAGLPPLQDPADQPGLPARPGEGAQQPGVPTPPPGVPAQFGQPGGPAAPFGGRTPPPGATMGNNPGRPEAPADPTPTPPSGIPATPFGGNQPGHTPTPPPGIPATPFGGQTTPASPGGHHPDPAPTPPPGIPATPFGGQTDGPASTPGYQPSPAPTPGIPATPFGGNQPGPAPGTHATPFGGQTTPASPGGHHPDPAPTPPPGIPATPFGGDQPAAPTPPPGIPATPFSSNQPGHAPTPPGIPATPFGGNQPGQEPPPSGLAGAFGPHPQATPGAPADQNDWFNR